MADTKISALTALDNADLAADDVLPIVDTNAVATKKITVANLLAGSPSNPNVQQSDIGTDPNQVPLNQYLGSMAYQDAEHLNTIGVNGVSFNGVASTDANMLDDYEEGDWTATLKGSVSDPTAPVTATARYTKIGDTVHIWGRFANVDTTGASGDVTVIGLPFTAGVVRTMGSVYVGNFPIVNKYAILYIPNAGTTITFQDVAGTGFGASLQHSAGAGRYLEFSATYKV